MRSIRSWHRMRLSYGAVMHQAKYSSNPYASPQADEAYNGPLTPGKAAGFTFFICLALGLMATALIARGLFADVPADVFDAISFNFARFQFQFRGASVSLLIASIAGIYMWFRSWRKCRAYEAGRQQAAARQQVPVA